jgi:hypothetical protein
VKDRSAVTLAGPTATSQQVNNGQLATFLYHCHSRLEKLEEEYPEAVFKVLKPNVQVCPSVISVVLTRALHLYGLEHA